MASVKGSASTDSAVKVTSAAASASTVGTYTSAVASVAVSQSYFSLLKLLKLPLLLALLLLCGSSAKVAIFDDVNSTAGASSFRQSDFYFCCFFSH